jgi:hypothetical protein
LLHRCQKDEVKQPMGSWWNVKQWKPWRI